MFCCSKSHLESRKNTYEIGRILYNTDVSKFKALNEIKDLKNYQASPVRRVYIPKTCHQQITYSKNEHLRAVWREKRIIE